jgi:hypothetical protein
VAERPTQQELLGAVRSFLEKELMPELEGVRRFHTRVAANALAIVARELELWPEQLPARHARLADLVGRGEPAPQGTPELARRIEELERELVARIRAGDADAGPFRARVLAHLHTSVRERLAVSNPGYR